MLPFAERPLVPTPKKEETEKQKEERRKENFVTFLYVILFLFTFVAGYLVGYGTCINEGRKAQQQRTHQHSQDCAHNKKPPKPKGM